MAVYGKWDRWDSGTVVSVCLYGKSPLSLFFYICVKLEKSVPAVPLLRFPRSDTVKSGIGGVPQVSHGVPL